MRNRGTVHLFSNFRESRRLCRAPSGMGRLARVVAVGVAHQITQRGVDRRVVFPSGKCRRVYLALLKEHASRSGLRILGYCLMTNHVHILAIPERAEGLAATFRYAHGRFAQYANAQQCRSGHFWQNRLFVSGRGIRYRQLTPTGEAYQRSFQIIDGSPKEHP